MQRPHVAGLWGVGVVSLLVLGTAACGPVGEPAAWTARELSLSVHYDTLPGVAADDTLPLQVTYNVVTNQVGHQMLYATVTAANLTGQALVGITGRYCNWMFDAYASPDLSGEPLWSDGSSVCPAAAMPLRLEAGATQVFPARWLPFDSIVGSRGPGTYYFGARLQGSIDGGADRWLTERLPAGRVQLVPDR
jgi:hypothetical protein